MFVTSYLASGTWHLAKVTLDTLVMSHLATRVGCGPLLSPEKSNHLGYLKSDKHWSNLLFYLLWSIYLMFERQIYLKLVGVFVAIHFSITINNAIHLYQSSLTTRIFCLSLILSIYHSLYIFFCLSVSLFFLSICLKDERWRVLWHNNEAIYLCHAEITSNRAKEFTLKTKLFLGHSWRGRVQAEKF